MTDAEKAQPPFRLGDTIERFAAAIAIVPIISALFYYVGRVIVSSTYAYFGIDVGMLNLSTTEYILRGASVAIVPFGFVLIMLLILIRIHPRIEHVAERVPLMLTLMLILGILLIGVSILLIFQAYRGLDSGYSLGALSVASAILLIAYSGYIRRQLAIRSGRSDPWTGPSAWPTRAFAVLAIVVAIYMGFIAAASFARYFGRYRAEQWLYRLDRQPTVTFYASKPLALQASGITVGRVNLPDATFQYRYSGFRLLTWSNGRYFLIPPDALDKGPSDRILTVIIVRESDVEFVQVEH